MPLSQPVAREAIHTRRVECVGYLRQDGLWDIEGHIVDTKTYRADVGGKLVEPGLPVHNMRLRIAVDDRLTIIDAEVSFDDAPHASCGEIASAYKQLIGFSIGPGFTRKVRELFAGRAGCTHITELTGPLATTAYQTVSAWLYRQQCEAGIERGSDEAKRLVDSCYALRSDGERVRTGFPEFYSGETKR